MNPNFDSKKWAVAAARAAEEKLGLNTVVIEVGPVMGISDYFVITNGSNNRQVSAIVDAVQEQLSRQAKIRPLHVEGKDERAWVLIDYGDFVVHVFDPEAREFYDLERFWKEQSYVDWQSEPGGEPSGESIDQPSGQTPDDAAAHPQQ